MKKEENKKLSDEEVQDKLRDAMNRMDIAGTPRAPEHQSHAWNHFDLTENHPACLMPR